MLKIGYFENIAGIQSTANNHLIIWVQNQWYILFKKSKNNKSITLCALKCSNAMKIYTEKCNVKITNANEIRILNFRL